MYTDKDFSRCLFNPMKKNLLETYPELENLFLPSGKYPDKEKLMKYVIFMYDLYSPVVKRADLSQRKREAATLAGYGEKDEDYLEEVFDMSNNDARDVIVRFLTTYPFAREWFMICANEQTFYEYGARLMKPIEAGETKEKDIMSATAIKSKLSEDMEQINLRIIASYKILTGDDELLKKNFKKPTSPESMATTV